MNLGTILALVLVLFLLVPVLSARMHQGRARVHALEALEKVRGTRVIVLIHRQETVGFLGVPLFRFIDIEDSEEVLRAIRLTPDDRPIDVVLHTPGGLVLASRADRLRAARPPGEGDGARPALRDVGRHADRARRGRDPPRRRRRARPGRPAARRPARPRRSSASSKKPIERLDDRTLIMADVAEKASGT